MRRLFATVLCVLVLGPLWPLYGLHVFAGWLERVTDRARDWAWCHRLIDVMERIDRWGDRPSTPVERMKIVTPKGGGRIVRCDPYQCSGEQCTCQPR